MAAGGGGRPPGSDSSLEPYVQTRIFKIIVIGDSNVGKTCLTFRFCGGTFPDKTEATIGVDFREKTVEIEGERIKHDRVLKATGGPLASAAGPKDRHSCKQLGRELYAGPAWFGEQMALRWKAGILQELAAEGLAAQC
ncbi:hypothetical protein Q9233_007957 [Columba guinea]|nr:hypothetical protein Q9233_007957 [Columba guinea]